MVLLEDGPATSKDQSDDLMFQRLLRYIVNQISSLPEIYEMQISITTVGFALISRQTTYFYSVGKSASSTNIFIFRSVAARVRMPACAFYVCVQFSAHFLLVWSVLNVIYSHLPYIVSSFISVYANARRSLDLWWQMMPSDPDLKICHAMPRYVLYLLHLLWWEFKRKFHFSRTCMTYRHQR